MRLTRLFAALLACAPSLRAADNDTKEYRRYYIDIHAPAFSSPAPGRMKYALREAQAPVEFATSKPAGVKRIFLIGGSVANYMARWPESVSWERRLGELKPGTTFEIINCGVPAYDAYRDALIFTQALAFEPDLIVVMSGNNEYYRPVSLPFPRLSLWLRRVGRVGRGADRPDRAERDAQFAKSLRRMAQAAKSRGVPVAFCSLPNNRLDLAPQSSLPLEYPEFREAWDLLEKGKRPEAAAAFRRFLERPLHGDVEAQARFYLGRATDGEESRAAYARAADLDSGEQQCPPRRNALIRQVAGQEGALFVDLDAAFAALPDGQRFGVFYDAVHWVPELNPFAAAVIAESLAAPLGLDVAGAKAWAARASGARRDEDYWRAAVFAGAQAGPRGIEAADALARRWPKDVKHLAGDKALFIARAEQVKNLWAGDGGTPESWWTSLLQSMAAVQRRRALAGEKR